MRFHAGEFRRAPVTVDLLCNIHNEIFKGIREHAGRYRRHDYGSDTLSFGPNRSIHRYEVEAALDAAFTELRKSIASFEQNTEEPSYESSALRLAAWVHATLIQIHPFEDGNGRACRLLMNAVLIRLGLRPIPLETPRLEYLACLNHFYSTNDIRPLEDLCLRLYPIT